MQSTLDKTEKIPTVYVAYSKYNFFAKQLISAFALQQGVTPLNPFMNWDYFLPLACLASTFFLRLTSPP